MGVKNARPSVQPMNTVTEEQMFKRRAEYAVREMLRILHTKECKVRTAPQALEWMLTEILGVSRI